MTTIIIILYVIGTIYMYLLVTEQFFFTNWGGLSRDKARFML